MSNTYQKRKASKEYGLYNQCKKLNDDELFRLLKEKKNDKFWRKGKKPDKCDELQELINCCDNRDKEPKNTQKAWNCRHSRQ
ncbi:hypothetical protein J4W41_24770 [Escherichia coli]